MPEFPLPHRQFVHSRRDFLTHCGGGFGGLALSALLAQDSVAFENATTAGSGTAISGRVAAMSPDEATRARPAHLPATARSVIFLFMDGGPS
ncbi:MAG: twin-arginine translocation signal domain-containing protein, partial [Planctomycetaceae bacterium]